MALGNVRLHYNVEVISHSGELLVILASRSACQRDAAGRKVKHNLLTLLFLSVRILQQQQQQQASCGAGIYSGSISLFSFLSPLIGRLLPAAWNRMARARCQRLPMQ